MLASQLTCLGVAGTLILQCEHCWLAVGVLYLASVGRRQGPVVLM